MFLRVKEHHSWSQEWPCHPCLRSGTLNVLQVPPFLTPLPDTLLIEISTRIFQGIFLWSNNVVNDIKEDPVLQVSNQQPSMSSKYPPSWPFLTHILFIKILTQNFQGIFFRVKYHHPWHQGWHCPLCLRSGTLNVLQVPPFLTQGNINVKLAWEASRNTLSWPGKKHK